MKQSLQLKIGQQLTMTPQLQQAIRLLQLSTMDLHQEVQQALESNLMLENADEAERLQGGDEGEAGAEGAADAAPDGIEARRDADSEQEIRPEEMPMPQDLPVDAEWTDHYDSYLSSTGAAAQEGADRDIYAQQSKAPSLKDHLEWQLSLSRLNPLDTVIALAVVDAIDEDGYLRVTTDELIESLGDDEITPEEIEAVLHRVQSLDPPGVGARNLRECLLIQLRQLADYVAVRDLAIRICDRHFDVLAKNDTVRLKDLLALGDKELADALVLIRSLNPRPGTLIANVETQYVIPDAIVRKQGNAWVVELNPETAPRLRVNPDYAKLIRRADQSDDNNVLKNHLQEARWFIKSLASRNDTVLRVAQKIVELQRDFLEYGEEAMKPMVLRDVAEALGLHESTVSRVTTQKYLHTPRGTFEFKYFFSSHVSTASGGECSSTAIRAFIRKLVAAENPQKPLSDNKLAAVLAGEGIKVARRTVAKYREAMGVPPSNERKRLG